MYFDYFAKKEWGDDYYQDPNRNLTIRANHQTIKAQVEDYFQQIVYSSPQRGYKVFFNTIYIILKVYLVILTSQMVLNLHGCR